MTDPELIAKKLARIETCVQELRTLARPERMPSDPRGDRRRSQYAGRMWWIGLLVLAGVSSAPTAVAASWAQETRSDPPRGSPSSATFDLHARVVGRDGVPAIGLALLVRPVTTDADPGGTRYAGQRGVVTDRDGAFELAGLECVPHVVRARAADSGSDHPFLLTAEPITAEQAESGVVVLSFSRPHVLVRLLDAEGRPWIGPGGGVREGYPETSWPSFPRAFAFGCAPLDDVPCLAGGAWRGVEVAKGAYVFEAGDESRGVVGVLGGDFPGEVRVVHLAPDDDRVTVELREAPRQAQGILSVRVVDSAGAPLGEERDGANLVVELHSASGGVPLVATGNHLDTAPFELRAPPGEYRLIARGHPSIEPYHGGLTRPRELGWAGTTVHVAGEAMRTVDLVLDAGGTLELTVTGDPWSNEYERFPESFLGGERLPAVRVFLVSPDGRHEGVSRRYEGLYQESLTCFWLLGRTQVSERVPTGRATVVGLLPGGRVVRVEVEIREGETTRATLAL